MFKLNILLFFVFLILNHVYISTQVGCENNPCKNGGKCVDNFEDLRLPKCKCQPNYSGLYCDVESACASKPCKNNGVCELSNLQRGYMCKCLSGYVGDTCEIRDPCKEHSNCGNGKCTLIADYKRQCQCDLGFKQSWTLISTSKCDIRDCPIKEYKFSYIKPNIYVSKGQKQLFNDLNKRAESVRLTLNVQKSFRVLSNPNENVEDEELPFLTGMAFTVMSITHKKQMLCDLDCLLKLKDYDKKSSHHNYEDENGPSEEIMAFLRSLETIGLTWRYNDNLEILANVDYKSEKYENERKRAQIGCFFKKNYRFLM